MSATYSTRGERYVAHTWNTGDPITLERITAIEQALANLSAENGIDMDNAVDLNSRIGAGNPSAGSITNWITTISETATNASEKADSALADVAKGGWAWDQIDSVTESTLENGVRNYTQTLAQRFETLETQVLLNQQGTLKNKVESIDLWVSEAKTRTQKNGNQVSFGSLVARLNDTDQNAETLSSDISTLKTNYTSAAGNEDTLSARLAKNDQKVQNLKDEIDAAHLSYANRDNPNNDVEKDYLTLDARFEASENAINTIKGEINAAHTSHALATNNVDKAYTSLDDRFEAIESELVGATEMSSRLDTIDGNISGLTSSKVNKTDVENNLTTQDSVDKHVLDARQGRILKETIDAMDTAYKAADTALDGRLDAVDGGSALDTTNGTLAQRVSALETEVGMTSTDSRIDTAISRLDAIDNGTNTMIDGINDKIDAIATELNMLDTGAIVSTNTRIDTIEGDVTTIKSDLNTASTGIKARLDAIDNASTGAIKALQDADEALDGRLDALDTAETGAIALLQQADTSLANRLDKIDGGSALDITNGTLSARVTTLEGKDTVVVPYDGEHSNFTSDVPNYANPTTNADYLIADDTGKYFYWRYFGAVDGWQLISGAGSGTGSSSGAFAATLADITAPDENTDYFVGNDTNGYIHYRYIAPTGNEVNGHFVMILPKGLIADISVDANGGLVAHTLEDSNTNLLSEFTALKNVVYTPIYDPNDNTTLASQRLTFSRINGEDEVIDIIGGGGGGTAYTVRIETTTDIARTYPANSTEPVTIRAKVVMKQGSDLVPGATATGQLQYRVYGSSTWNMGDRIEIETENEALKYIIPNDTYFTIDVTKYLEVDKTIQFRLAIAAHPESEEIDVMRYQSYTVSKVNISIADEDFDYASVKNSNFQFNYRCFGSGIAKTVHFLLDGTDVVTPVSTTSHNAVLSQVIPIAGEENGMHTFQVYFVTNTGLRSNTLNYYILYNTDNTREAPLLGAAAENATITDGDELIINYSVATIGSETTEAVEINMYTDLNSDPIQTTNLTDVTNNTLQTWRTFSYPKVTTSEPITVYVVLTASHGTETTSQTVEVTVNQLITTYTLDPEGEINLVYSYEAYGRSNNDANKNTYTYTYTNVSGQDITFTGTLSNFNWATDGYVDGKSLTIGGGATYSIDVPIFSNNKNNISFEENAGDQNVLQQDITQKGRTIEIDYEVQSATNLNATIIDCMSNNHRGFRVTPQSCYLLNSSTDIEIDDSGFILNEDQIAAAYLSPGQRTHLVFVIEPWATDAARDAAFDGEYHQSVNIYVNGEFANACPYNRDKNSGITTGNDFSTNATITIGSDTCLIKLYSIKLYNRGLTQEQVLQNYKVAPVATRDKLARLEENDILNAAGLVDYEKAKKKYTCLLLTGPAPTTQTGAVVPTVSPFKGSPSPAGRRDKKTNEIVGKTESGLTLTKPSKTEAQGYTVEFDLQDTIPAGAPAYMGAVGSYCSSNNVQGTSSQKYPIHNLKVYLAKYNAEKTTTKNVLVEQGEEIPEGVETVEIDGQTYKVVTETTPAEIKKVKYSLKGYNNEGVALGTEESTLCWKADYMSTDHANTFNANVADGLFNNRAEDGWPITNWAAKKYQNTVYGIRCLLFQKQGDNAPEFIGDGCLNNDKGNSKTYGLERDDDENNDTTSQKWEFTNNSEDLGYFKTDDLFSPLNGKIRAKNGFESTYPDEGDLDDAQKAYKAAHNNEENPALNPNYNHLQVLLTWVSKRANYWDETDPTAKAAKKAIFRAEFGDHFILSHVLTYYIFLQYTALCDNRVKNMFLRSDTIRDEIILNTNSQQMIVGNAYPQDDPTGTRWAQYVNMTTGVTDPTVIDWTNSTFAKWVPVLYDLDSCFGVENVGLIKIRYDADWDYEWKETPQFNGYNSVFWLMVEDTFKDEIATLALSLYNQQPGLNFRTFNQQQIIENQQQISPALTNQDMILKFDKPWSEGFINYAETPDSNGNYPKQTPQYKYLQRGSRAAQKSQFMQQRSMLLSSYYGADEFLNSSIKFRTGVPVGASGNVIGYENAAHEVVSVQDEQHTIPIYGNGDLTETQITVKANQILYPGVAYGDNKPATRYLLNDGKVAANTSCTIQATSAVQGNDGIFIYGASVLTDIGDISKFKPLQLDVSAGVNLKRLIIGSNATGYSNNTTNSITGLNKCILLEEINVRNLKQMATLSLTSNGFIKSVYAGGSGIGTISLPQGGVLETIEYGANTTDITILNQSRLTNFSYEDSVNNNYANVTRLWIENTPNVPVKDIITARLTSRSSADQGLRAGGLRVVGIDLNLGADASFLQLLVSELAQGTYLTARGGHTEGTTDYPYISGTIRIASIRRSLYNQLQEHYPDLTIQTSQITQEYEIRYENYDGTLLYTDHGTNEDNIKDPVIDTNPITNNPYIEMPTKPADAQYRYRFGLYNASGNYRRFTGWVKKGTTTNPGQAEAMNGDITLVAVYPTTEDQYYDVTWQIDIDDETNKVVRSVKYGLDLSSELSPMETGIFQKIQTSGNKVRVFKGWSSPLGKIKGDVTVYALWEESTINESTQSIVMENLTAADVYALSQVSNSKKQALLQDNLGSPIMVHMGQEFDYPEGVNITNLLGHESSLLFDGDPSSAIVYNNITPLSTNGDWTLALDYKFLIDDANYFYGNEYVLASCYKNANSSIVGFKVSLIRNNSGSVHSIVVTWGTASVTVDLSSTVEGTFKSYRNVVVISHNSDAPNVLRVSHTEPNLSNSNTSDGSMFSTTLRNTQLTWNNNTLIDTPLILGGNYQGATTTIEENDATRRPAQGVIYWAKFWDTDLGEINSTNLAAWPHETVPFLLTGYNGSSTRTTEQIYANSSLSFAAAQGLGDRYFTPYGGMTGVDSNGLYGWHQSMVRTICNNLIYTGLPETYRAIIKQQTVVAFKRQLGEGATIYDTAEPNTEDYLFLSALREVDESTTTSSLVGSEVQTRWTGPWYWFINPCTIYQLYGTTSNIVEANTATTDNYYLYRFSGKYISKESRIFRLSQNPARINNFQMNANGVNTPITLQSGDVWVDDNNLAYIYCSANDIAHGTTVDIQESSGGWKQAMDWGLRTYSCGTTGATSAQEYLFLQVTKNGTFVKQPTTTTSRGISRLICPEFTV